MEAHLIVEYDRAGDILYLGRTAPYPEQDTEELEYGVVARLNPTTKEVENLEILFFNQRLVSGVALQLLYRPFSNCRRTRHYRIAKRSIEVSAVISARTQVF